MTDRGFHHVAFACRDIDATQHFYQELMGYPLVHTEVKHIDGGMFRHVFYALEDGSAIAFFDMHGAGEAPGWDTAISTGNGLPVWVNHVAFGATSEKQEMVRGAMAADGIEPLMELDHGWCHSLYFLDPNGIMVELCRDTPGLSADAEEAVSRLHSDVETDRSRAIIARPT
ncbi:MAG: VOC family protein [Actinomycetia bacterium]|nr:VOC family protein [Actinomycetes bacterium]